MLLTKECDYGLRIVRALASGEKRTADEICAAESIPSQFAYKILKKLERAGFIQSSRGREGGYWLTKTIDEITIYDIVSTIYENLFINECLRDDRDCINHSPDNMCAVHHELTRIQNILITQLRMKTISQIVADGK